jgi:hypothetical protein
LGSTLSVIEMRLPGRNREEMPEGLEEALRRAFLDGPPPRTMERHLAMIDAARAEAATREADATPAVAPGRRQWRAASPRVRLVIVIAAAVLGLPVVFSGLALAGVHLPEAVDSAFESVGIDLPNQPEDEGGDEADRTPGDEPGTRESAGGEPDAASGDGADTVGGGADRRSGAQAEEGGSRPSDADGGVGNGEGGRPSHAQDGQTGAPPHSEQGGQGAGTPAPHAQDGAGGPPPHAQDGVGGPPSHAQGGAAKEQRPVKPAAPTPKPKEPKPAKPAEPESEDPKPDK